MASYLTSSAADALAAALLPLAAYSAANDAMKAAALEQASMRFDRSYVWQGRKAAIGQDLEFPRIAYDSGIERCGVSLAAYVAVNLGRFRDVWDWDPTAKEAVVPPLVLRAVIFEANSVLAGDRGDRLAAQHDGVASQSIGSASESYRDRRPPVLCIDADIIAQHYRLRQGRIE